ncbi:FAD:protein FMN transferase [Spongiibacter sp. KMU-166]|uniref:FAD:protein FMN transferase n=1 Tax=Spongiibacter thalassae TaxID=2721624 RepID=A0ABX1GJ28_9GAMM|nr:FAD:protein FMN transferase [Spongiibacter thalassae]NKI19244.1 FAD:protein FMN transferase [Spongiibacter thalassae]
MEEYHYTFTAMASPCELRLYAATRQQADRAAALAQAEVQRIEYKYSRYRDDSVLSAINRAAGQSSLRVDDETAALLGYADTAWQQSGGLFDITSGVLRRAWDFKSGLLPTDAAIAELLPLIGWQRVVWNGREVSLPLAGMQLDFGGFGKEYAADAAARVCGDNGIQHGLVELGGDIHAIGPHPDGSPWRIGIRHPRAPESAIAVLALHSGGLASSGDYERYMVIDGRRYSHLLNPETGWPVTGNLASVSVVAPLCLIAGTGATVALLKGEQGSRWLETLGLPHLSVDAQGQLGGSVDFSTQADLKSDAVSD